MDETKEYEKTGMKIEKNLFKKKKTRRMRNLSFSPPLDLLRQKNFLPFSSVCVCEFSRQAPEQLPPA